MIADSFTFKKTSWHIKLTKFIWGFEYTDFQNMCPYFWLNVFTVLFLPLILLVKGLFYISKNSISYINKYLEARTDKWMEEYGKKILSSEAEMLKFANRKLTGKYYRLFWSSKYNGIFGVQWQKIYELISKRENIEMDKYYNNYNSRIENKKRINSIVDNIKKIFYPIIWLILLFTTTITIYYFFKLILYIGNISVEDWIYGAIIALELSVIIILLIFIIYGSITLTENINIDFSKLEFLFKPFVWLWTGLTILFKIIIMFKKDNCPALVWED